MAFPGDFPIPLDQGGPGQGQPVGGFGGDPTGNQTSHRATVQRVGKTPVLLIHGNEAAADMTQWNLLDLKDMLNGARPITPEERELVQSFIMNTYDKFLGIVAKERNLPADLLRNTIADGRILSGKDAFEHKLIDGLGELDDAFRKAKELGNAPDAKVVKYGPPFSLSRFFRIFGETDSKIELTLPKQLIPQLESGRAYFLPSYYAP